MRLASIVCLFIYSQFLFGSELPDKQLITIRIGTDIGLCNHGAAIEANRVIEVNKKSETLYLGEWEYQQSLQGVDATFKMKVYQEYFKGSWNIMLSFKAWNAEGEQVTSGLTYFRDVDPAEKVLLNWTGEYIRFSGLFEGEKCRYSLGFYLKDFGSDAIKANKDVLIRR